MRSVIFLIKLLFIHSFIYCYAEAAQKYSNQWKYIVQVH